MENKTGLYKFSLFPDDPIPELGEVIEVNLHRTTRIERANT